MLSERALWRELARTVLSPQTIALRLLQQAPPSVPFLLPLRAQGKCSPSNVSLAAALPRCGQPLFAWQCRPGARVTPVWCQSRVVFHATTSNRPRRLRVCVHRARGPLPDPCRGQKCWSSLSPLLLCTPVLLPAQVETLFTPRPPPHCTLLDDGQKSPVGGHIGRCVRSREGVI